MTVIVDTPTGEVSGTSTAEVNARYAGPNSMGNEVHYSQRGEAVVVKLPNDRYLFALLSGPELARGVFRDVLPRERQAYLQSMDRLTGRKAKLSKRLSPLLVTFDDIDDPASVKRVDPANLAAAFGCPSVAAQASGASAGARTGGGADAPAKDKPCYALKSITLEITDEPVTTGKVEEVLGWLGGMTSGMLDGRKFSTIQAENRLANDLSNLDFLRR